MAETAAQPRQQPTRRQAEDAAAENAVLAALTVVMLAGVGPQEMTKLVGPLLAPLGIPAPVVAAVVGLLVPHVAPPSVEGSRGVTATAWAERTEPARHAAYLLRAGQRLAEQAGHVVYRAGQDPVEQEVERIGRALTADDVERERVNLRRHLDAGRLRREAAAAVDREAAVRGPWLGWHATLDSRTTGECKLAHGHNFHVARPPQIGYPGMPHGGTCRCRPGVPHASRLTVDQALTGSRVV